MKIPGKSINAKKDDELLRLHREVEILKRKYSEKCLQLETFQNEDILLRRIQELLTLQEKYQLHLQEQNTLIQNLRREKLTLETQRSALEEIISDHKILSEQLETQLKECQDKNSLYLQTAWQEALQIMESDYVLGQNRIYELEHKVSELQEQVLAQAKQKNEYETALQYLQEQSLHFQQYAFQLSSALERLFDEHKEWKKAEISFRVDLPSFLVKNRSYF